MFHRVAAHSNTPGTSYDRISPSFRGYLETLTATCSQLELFKSSCETGGYAVTSPRGSPLNRDFEFAPSHPVVRTHPVTGWKSVFAGAGLHITRINGGIVSLGSQFCPVMAALVAMR